jgi:triphosphoribosyl-dephospho-CoA synthetase
VKRLAVSDLDILRTATLVIQQHGESAAYYAAGRADELLEQGTVTGAATWRKIVEAIEKLQAMEPEGGARH